MKNIKLVIFLVFIVNLGCKNSISLKTFITAFNESSNEEINYYLNKSEKFVLDEKSRIIFPVYVNDTLINLMFDTGGFTLFYDKKIIKKYIQEGKNYYHNSGMYLPNNEKLEIYSFIIDSLKSQIFYTKHKASRVIHNFHKKTLSCSDINRTGILGNDIFWDSPYPVNFDFTNHTIKLLNGNPSNYIGYYKINSKFDLLGDIKIQLILKNKKVWAKFDTGYTGYIHLKSSSTLEKKIWKSRH